LGDAKKEIENFVKKDVASEKFQQADKLINSLLEQGGHFSDRRKYDQALECYHKALVQADKLYGKESTASALIYTRMGTVFLKKGEKLKAADSVAKASTIYKRSLGGMLVPHSYYVLSLQAARIYCVLKKNTVALNILKELESEIEKVPQKLRAEVYFLIAECYYRKNKFTNAVKYCEMANKESTSDIKTDDFKAKNYDIWSVSLTALGKSKEAIDKLQKCIKYAVKAKKNNTFMGQVFLNTGTNYIDLKDYSNAKKSFSRALKCFQKIKEDALYWQGVTYLLLARNARWDSRWKEAEEKYERAVALLEEYLISDKQKANLDGAYCCICMAFKWLPKCYLQNKKLERIDILYPKLGMLQKIKNRSIDLGNVYSSWAAFYVMLDKYDKAIYLSDCGLKIFRSLPQDEYIKKQTGNLLWSKAKALHLSGKSRKAFQVGTQAYNNLEKYYSNSPHIIKKLQNMLGDMKNGTPFKQGEVILYNIECQKSIERVHNLYSSGKYAAAEKTIRDLLKTAKEKEVTNKFLSHLYFLLGRNLITQRKKMALKPLEKSLHYFSKVKKGKEQFFNDYLTYDLYSFLSLAYSLNNQSENSLKYAKLVHKIVLEKYPHDLSKLIKSSITLAFAYRACDDNKNAVKYAQRTLELMKKDPALKSRMNLIENSIREWSK
jgi:tetratricopeptide (TPR) repeat protein